VLIEFAHRLSQPPAARDTAARLAGYEFAVLCEAAGYAEMTSVAEQLRALLRSPFHLDSGTLLLSVSIAVPSADSRYDNGADLLCQADRAMYRAKNERRPTAESNWPDRHRPHG
jgi:diguanylate cyclase (GGDEF)-like protein